MAPAQSKRQSRKRRRPRAGQGASAVAKTEPRSSGQGQPARGQTQRAREAQPAREEEEGVLGALATTFTGATYGEPPPNPWGGVPVAEIAIFSGAIGVLAWLISGAVPALIVGIVVCTLGVVEFTAREHFSGYRSHAALLAAIPAVGVGIALIALASASLTRAVLLPVVAAVFGVLFWLLRNRFRVARQARVARPPSS